MIFGKPIWEYKIVIKDEHSFNFEITLDKYKEEQAVNTIKKNIEDARLRHHKDYSLNNLLKTLADPFAFAHGFKHYKLIVEIIEPHYLTTITFHFYVVEKSVSYMSSLHCVLLDNDGIKKNRALNS